MARSNSLTYGDSAKLPGIWYAFDAFRLWLHNNQVVETAAAAAATTTDVVVFGWKAIDIVKRNGQYTKSFIAEYTSCLSWQVRIGKLLVYCGVDALLFSSKTGIIITNWCGIHFIIVSVDGVGNDVPMRSDGMFGHPGWRQSMMRTQHSKRFTLGLLPANPTIVTMPVCCHLNHIHVNRNLNICKWEGPLKG